MGRTNPTYRYVLQQFRERWGKYRRGLRRQHQDDFDRLLEHADEHAAAAGYMNAEDPELMILISLLLAHEIKLRELSERLEEREG